MPGVIFSSGPPEVRRFKIRRRQRTSTILKLLSVKSKEVILKLQCLTMMLVRFKMHSHVEVDLDFQLRHAHVHWLICLHERFYLLAVERTIFYLLKA